MRNQDFTLRAAILQAQPAKRALRRKIAIGYGSTLSFISAIGIRDHVSLIFLMILWPATGIPIAFLFLLLRGTGLAFDKTSSFFLAAQSAELTEQPLFFEGRSGISWANDAFARLAGCSHTELARKRFKDLFSSETEKAALFDWTALDKHSIPSMTTLTAMNLSGNRLTLFLCIQPVFTTQLVLEGVVVSLIDVTAREAIEQNLRKTAKQAHQQAYEFRRILDSIPAAVSYWSKDGICKFANQAHRGLFSIDPTKLEGQSLQNAYGKAYYDRRAAYVVGVLAGKHQRFETIRELPQDTEPRYMHSEYVPDWNNNTVKGFYTLSYDVTSQKLAEEQAIRQQALANATSKLTGVGGWEFDPRIPELIWSETVRHIHEIPAGPLPTLSGALEFYPPGAREQVSRAIATALKAGTSFDLTLPFVTYTGRARWVRIACEPQVSEGVCNRLIGALQDVTAEVDSAKDLKTAKEAAESASRAKDEFLANMSHEIRTPLNGVLGMIALLLETQLDTEQQELARIAKSNGEALLSVLNNILDFSKIESGHLELENIEFRLRRTIDEAIDTIALKAAEKALELVIDIRPSVPCICKGDPTRLRQILINLLSNAVKFTENGDVRLTVNRLKAESGNVKLSFEVKDTGIGIAENRLTRLFTPFTQADASTTRRYGGTGLGLVICQRLIKAMGGRIHARSKCGSGTTFYFEVLLGEATETTRTLGIPNLQMINILIVDKHTASASTLSEQLSACGFNVDIAQSAAAGRQAYCQRLTYPSAYHLVFLDEGLEDPAVVELAGVFYFKT